SRSSASRVQSIAAMRPSTSAIPAARSSERERAFIVRPRSVARLPLEQRALALDTPAVTRQATVAANDAVTRYRDGEHVRRARGRDGARGGRRPDSPRELGVARGVAGRNLAHRLPDALLKGGAANIERQFEADLRRLDEADDPRDERLECFVAADEARPRKSILQVTGQSVRIVADRDGADAALALRDENRAERAFADSEADLRTLSTLAITRRRHAEHRVRFAVEAPVRAVACIVDGIGNRFAFGERIAHALRAVRSRIRARSDAGHRAKRPVQMVRAQAGACRERVERRHALGGLD